MVGRERKDNLGGVGNKMVTELLVLDGTKNGKEVDQHHMVGKLRPIVKAVDLTTVLGDASKWKDVVKIHTKVGIDVVDEGLDRLVVTTLMIINRQVPADECV